MTRYTVTTRRRGWPILRGLVVIFLFLGIVSYASMPLAQWLGALAILGALVLVFARSVRRSRR